MGYCICVHVARKILQKVELQIFANCPAHSHTERNIITTVVHLSGSRNVFQLVCESAGALSREKRCMCE